MARWLLLIGVVAATVQLLRTGVADFLRLQPCAYLDFLQASGKRPDAGVLGAARGRLELARRVHGADPVIEEYLAVLFVHRSNLVADDAPLRIAYLEKATSHYAEALALRSHSAYLWAGLTTVRAALLQSRLVAGPQAAELVRERSALRHAMQRTMALAGYEPQVLAAVARAGASLQAVLTDDDLALVDEARRRLRALGIAPA